MIRISVGILIMFLLFMMSYCNIRSACAKDKSTVVIHANTTKIGKYLAEEEKKLKQILLQAKRDWGEEIDAPFLARKEYELNYMKYKYIVLQLKQLGIFKHNDQKTKEEKIYESYNRRHR